MAEDAYCNVNYNLRWIWILCHTHQPLPMDKQTLKSIWLSLKSLGVVQVLTVNILLCHGWTITSQDGLFFSSPHTHTHTPQWSFSHQDFGTTICDFYINHEWLKRVSMISKRIKKQMWVCCLMNSNTYMFICLHVSKSVIKWGAKKRLTPSLWDRDSPGSSSSHSSSLSTS